jgi:hypothetical protein
MQVKTLGLIALAMLAIPASSSAATKPTTITIGPHDLKVVDAENKDAMAVCELAYASSALIEESNPGAYGHGITARAVHNLTPEIATAPPTGGLAWLLGASGGLVGDYFTYTDTCVSGAHYIFHLVVVNQFETFAVRSTSGTWEGGGGKHGTWAKLGSDTYSMTTDQ